VNGEKLKDYRCYYRLITNIPTILFWQFSCK